MDLQELRTAARLIDRLAKRALFAEKQMVALEGQCAEWRRIADELKAERNAAKQEAVPPPEASHITPEGKRTAEGAVEPKPGDVVRLVRVPTLKEYPHSGCWEPNWGGIDDHMRVHYVGSNITGIRVVRAVFGLEWPVSCVEVVKGADK